MYHSEQGSVSTDYLETLLYYVEFNSIVRMLFSPATAELFVYCIYKYSAKIAPAPIFTLGCTVVKCMQFL